MSRQETYSRFMDWYFGKYGSAMLLKVVEPELPIKIIKGRVIQIAPGPKMPEVSRAEAWLKEKYGP